MDADTLRSHFVILMPLVIEGGTPTRVLLLIGMELMCVALLAGFWLPARIGHWAFRVLAGFVFLAYAAYLIHEFFFTDTPFRLVESRGAASPRNALLGFVIIGLPSLLFAVLGRFTLRRPPAESEVDEDRLESDDNDT